MADMLLLIEDEPLLGAELARHFKHGGWDVAQARTLAEARQLLLEKHLDPLVVVSDMSLPDGNALDLLEKLRSQSHGAEWLFLTGFGTVADSVRALRLGAYDFLEKPCDMGRLDLVVAGATRSARAQRRLKQETDEQSRRYSPEAFIGRSKAAQEVRSLLSRLSAVPFSALLISGETGTGKGLAARILHHSGPRRGGPLVEVNCAALPRELLESELFGHEAGAFTGAKGRRRGLMEQAHGGTLFLDEISEMSLELQAKLLKAIEDHRFRRLGGNEEIAIDVRIIAATNRNLAQRVAEGTFRSDLFHRLNVFNLQLPSLRSRGEDLDDLVPAFVAEFNAKAGRSVRVIPEGVWRRLRAYSWPGNVRELRNAVERCVLLADTQVFPEQWLSLEARSAPAPPEARPDGLWVPLDGSMSLDDLDRQVIAAALERAGYNVTAAARMLGSTRETLRYRIQKYGLKSVG